MSNEETAAGAEQRQAEAERQRELERERLRAEAAAVGDAAREVHVAEGQRAAGEACSELQALVAKGEAKRLRQTAAKTKAARKS